MFNLDGKGGYSFLIRIGVPFYRITPKLRYMHAWVYQAFKKKGECSVRLLLISMMLPVLLFGKLIQARQIDSGEATWENIYFFFIHVIIFVYSIPSVSNLPEPRTSITTLQATLYNNQTTRPCCDLQETNSCHLSSHWQRGFVAHQIQHLEIRYICRGTDSVFPQHFDIFITLLVYDVTWLWCIWYI